MDKFARMDVEHEWPERRVNGFRGARDAASFRPWLMLADLSVVGHLVFVSFSPWVGLLTRRRRFCFLIRSNVLFILVVLLL